MWILGIDPGITSLGYSIVKIKGKDSLKLINCGMIKTTKEKNYQAKLIYIFQSINELLSIYPLIYHVVTEEVYFYRNYRSALWVAQVNAVIALACFIKNKFFFSYSPLEIKKVIVGWGRATKEQLRYTAKLALKEEEELISSLSSHIIDSISVTLCHFYNRRGYNRTYPKDTLL
jgi:crossover junction endodeoxyribonuclease RuvC